MLDIHDARLLSSSRRRWIERGLFGRRDRAANATDERTPLRNALAPGDRQQPRFQARVAAKRADVAEGAEKRLLGGVFRLLAVQSHRKRGPEDHVLVAFDDGVEGRAVA